MLKNAIPKKPVRVAVTGAAGAIAYSLLFRIAQYGCNPLAGPLAGLFLVAQLERARIGSGT